MAARRWSRAPKLLGVIMQSQQCEAVLVLLEQGAVLEQTSEAPVVYTLRYADKAVQVPGGVMQQLLAQGRLRPVCRVSGRVRYLAR